MALPQRLAAFAFAVLALGAVPSTARAAGCAPGGYAYAGLQVPAARHGIGATITSLAPPVVERGHVAGWVGVGGPGQGPNGTDEWLQVGMNTPAGAHGRNKLYFEVACHQAFLASGAMVPLSQRRLRNWRRLERAHSERTPRGDMRIGRRYRRAVSRH